MCHRHKELSQAQKLWGFNNSFCHFIDISRINVNGQRVLSTLQHVDNLNIIKNQEVVLI